MVRRCATLGFALILAVMLSGCYVSGGYYYYEDDYDYDNSYAVGFTATAVGVTSKHSISCPCGTAVELALSLRNDGPYDDAYATIGGRSHRFLIYDDWGYLVWDSWLHAPASSSAWLLPYDATITFSETWDLRDDLGYELPPGLYTVEARFTGSVAEGPMPADPAPILIEILPTVSG